jgi:dehydrogenase/reductase SDR family member 7B
MKGSVMSQTVWVVGASSGIGAALASVYARAGARVMLSARRRESLEQQAGAIERSGGRAEVLPFDIADTSQLGHHVESALARFGAIDTIVLCAGIGQHSLAKDTRLDVDRRVMDVNFFGPIALAKAILPTMIERRTGQFIVISSIAGKLGVPQHSSYAASKHALHGFFDSLRAEAHEHGIRVSIACPGYVNTNISVNALTGDGSPYGRVEEQLQSGMDVEECARTIRRLAAAGREEFTIARGKERLAIPLKRFAPWLASRAVRVAHSAV